MKTGSRARRAITRDRTVRYNNRLTRRAHTVHAAPVFRAITRDEAINYIDLARAGYIDAAARRCRVIAYDRTANDIRKTLRDVNAGPVRIRAARDRKITQRIDVRICAEESNNTNLTAAAERDIIRAAVDTNALLDQEFRR